MSDRRRRRRTSIVAPLALAALVPLAAHGGDVRIAASDCGHDVHVVAQDAPLSSVLKRLSETLHFAFVYHAKADPRVTTDTRSSAMDLVRTLAREMNFSVEQTVDRRCESGGRIARLSILSDRDGAAPAVTTPSRPAWMTPEMERIGRLGLSDYLRSHGMEDQPMEELVVH